MEKKYFFLELYKVIILTVIAILMALYIFRLVPGGAYPDKLNNLPGQISGAGQSELNRQNLNAAREAVISDLASLAVMAQQYYKTSRANGGGGNSFEGWSIPPQLWTTGNGSYSLESSDVNSITLTGEGNVNGEENKVKVTMVVGPDRIISRKIIN